MIVIKNIYNLSLFKAENAKLNNRPCGELVNIVIYGMYVELFEQRAGEVAFRG